MTAPANASPWQRLHPLTPLLKGAKILAAAIAAISWQGYAELGFLGWLVTVAMVLVLGVAVAAVSWAVTGYEVYGRCWPAWPDSPTCGSRSSAAPVPRRRWPISASTTPTGCGSACWRWPEPRECRQLRRPPPRRRSRRSG